MSSYSNSSFKRLPSETHGNHDKVLSGILKREPVTVQNVNLSVSRNSKFDVINPFMNAFAAVALVATPMANAVTMESIAKQSNSLLYAMGAQEIGLQTSYISLAVIFDAGLVTSLSPFAPSVLPLTHGYIASFLLELCGYPALTPQVFSMDQSNELVLFFINISKNSSRLDTRFCISFAVGAALLKVHLSLSRKQAYYD